MKHQDFATSEAFDKSELLRILSLARTLKRAIALGDHPALLAHKTLGILTHDQATHTVAVLSTAMEQLGGSAVVLTARGAEDAEVLGHTLSHSVDLLAVRAETHAQVATLARFADVPVLNARSDYAHPLAELGDALTMLEHLPEGKQIEECKIVFVGGATPICASAMMMATKLGAHFVHLVAEGQILAEQLLNMGEMNAKASGGSFAVTESEEDALTHADFLYLGCGTDESRESGMSIAAPAYCPTPERLHELAPHARILHHHPAQYRRSERDLPHLLVAAQSENRLAAARALLVFLLRHRLPPKWEREATRAALLEQLHRLY